MAIWNEKLAIKEALFEDSIVALDKLAIEGKSSEIRSRAKFLADGLIASRSIKSQDAKHKIRLAVKVFLANHR